MHRGSNAHLPGKKALQSAALGLALVAAVSLQARPLAPDGLRLSAKNVDVSAGDGYQTGRGLLAAGDIVGAIAAFREAVLTTPGSIDALNALAVCYDRLGSYSLSRTYYDLALAVDPASTLVLNNLGYSLYLQGEFEAAIPVLQKAAASPDQAISATSHRVLALVAAKLTEAAAQTSTAQAMAEINAPQAHIELAANGEQRLVLGAPAPDRALVASLGDDAALVTIARPWTAADERALVRREAAIDRADAEIAARSAAAAPATAIDVAAADAVAPAFAPAANIAAVALETVSADRTAPSPVTPRRATSTRRAPAIAKARAPVTFAQNGNEAEPAWLLASRRVAEVVN